jgi:hypothetical protein
MRHLSGHGVDRLVFERGLKSVTRPQGKFATTLPICIAKPASFQSPLPVQMKNFLTTSKTWLNQERNKFQVWRYRIWQGDYQTLAERQISPHLRDAKLIFWLACTFSLISIGWGAGLFERSGAVLIVAGIFLEHKISRARTAAGLIRSGTVSPHGFLCSGHWPGQFLQEWDNESVNGAPVSFWLMGQENLMLKLEGRMNWLLISGTVVWGYGSLILGKIYQPS